MLDQLIQKFFKKIFAIEIIKNYFEITLIIFFRQKQKKISINNIKKMQIQVKLLIGLAIRLEVEESDSIKSIRAKIHDKAGYPTDLKKFPEIIYDGKKLDDNCKLSDYNIQNESVLYLVMRFRE